MSTISTDKAQKDTRYDPQYDPLVDSNPGAGRNYAPTYWVATAGSPPEDDGPVTQDMDVDVVVIGSGSTGISTALYLAQEHGIKAVVLEANQSAWGCSSRSGGQGQNASGRRCCGAVHWRLYAWWLRSCHHRSRLLRRSGGVRSGRGRAADCSRWFVAGGRRLHCRSGGRGGLFGGACCGAHSARRRPGTGGCGR